MPRKVAGWTAGGLDGDQTFYAKVELDVREKFGAGSTTKCPNADIARALAAAINGDRIEYIAVPNAAGDSDDYVALFEATANGDEMTIGFTAAAALAQTNATDGVATVAARAIPLAEAAEAATSFSPTGLTPGLWYSVISGETATSIETEGERRQAQSDGTLGWNESLTVPHPSDRAGFFRIKVSPADKD